MWSQSLEDSLVLGTLIQGDSVGPHRVQERPRCGSDTLNLSSPKEQHEEASGLSDVQTAKNQNTAKNKTLVAT